VVSARTDSRADRFRGLRTKRLSSEMLQLLLLFLASSSLVAQTPPDIAQERADYLNWLRSAANSPLAALAQRPVGDGLTLGPAGSDIPLPGLERHRLIREGAALNLVSPRGRHTIVPGSLVRVGDYAVQLSRAPRGPLVTVYGSQVKNQPPGYYPYDPALVFTGPLLPPESAETVRILGPDGIEVEATEAGVVRVPLAGETRLGVRRIPTAGTEESELEIFFRDHTNGQGTYPAGRFVSLLPVGGGKYQLDFNRARNPFCAYSSAYACPLPWKGNLLPVQIRAGERYSGGGLELVPTGPSPAGSWRAVLELAGGQLPFTLLIEQVRSAWAGRVCSGRKCQPLSAVRPRADSLVLEIADYDARIVAAMREDSLVGFYRNVGSKGPRTIPFRADRGQWAVRKALASLLGSWDATYFQDLGTSPRVLMFRNDSAGLQGTIISSTADYGPFVGSVVGDSFALGHFDGSFVYLLTGKLQGDTLRGIFHAGARTQTPWIAVRSTGAPHLKSPSEVSRADTTEPLRFAFPDLEGRTVRSDDPRFKGKVVLVDIFGSWCPTCHDATPELLRLYRRYRDRGLEIVGLAFEATGDTAVDARQVRRYRDKFAIPFPLLLAGVNDPESISASLPQLQDVTAFPTVVFVGRDGRVRRVHAGFHGLAAGPQHAAMVRDFEEEIERLLREKA
jgi:thiol-disulfide isomerase/thioredoxin